MSKYRFFDKHMNMQMMMNIKYALRYIYTSGASAVAGSDQTCQQ